MTNEPHDRPPLAEDPDFLESLSGLDRGLLAREAERPPAPPVARPVASLPEPPEWLALAEQASKSPAPPAPVPAGGRRPLIDLFPPAQPAGPAPRPTGPSATRAPVSVLAPPAASQEYEAFYGLDDNPFGASTDPKFFFHSATHDRAAQKLLTAIRAREGLVVITGAPGVGKTMLCRTVVEELDRRTLTSLVADPSVTVEDLLRTLLGDFGVISKEDQREGLRTASAHDLQAALRDFLQSLAALQAGAVAILDGAERLSTDVLERVRTWTDADTELRLLQVVLVGEPSLTARLRRRELRPLDRKVAVRIALDPLPADEIDGYVAHRLAVAGSNPRVEFDAHATSAIHGYAAGVPREVNTLCDRALMKAHAASAAVVDAAMVAEAADDLDLVPPERPAAVLARRVALVLVFVLLVLAGAAGAAFVFQERFDRLVQQWGQTPPQ